MGQYRTTAAATAAAADGVTVHNLSSSDWTLENDGDGYIASLDSAGVNFAAVSGSSPTDATTWARAIGPALQSGYRYTVMVVQVGGPTVNLRAGVGVGWRDDNRGAFVMHFSSGSSIDTIAVFGTNGSPTETLPVTNSGNPIGVRSSFEVSTDGKISELLPLLVMADGDGDLLTSHSFGTATTEITLANPKLCCWFRRGTSAGTASYALRLVVTEEQIPSLT